MEETEEDEYTIGQYYIYKGRTNRYYRNGVKYKFLGYIACTCATDCGGLKMLFYSPAGVPMWEKTQEIQGSISSDFYTDKEMEVLEDSTIKVF